MQLSFISSSCKDLVTSRNSRNKYEMTFFSFYSFNNTRSKIRLLNFYWTVDLKFEKFESIFANIFLFFFPTKLSLIKNCQQTINIQIKNFWKKGKLHLSGWRMRIVWKCFRKKNFQNHSPIELPKEI